MLLVTGIFWKNNFINKMFGPTETDSSTVWYVDCFFLLRVRAIDKQGTTTR